MIEGRLLTYHNSRRFFIGPKLHGRRDQRCALWAETEIGVTKVP